LTAIKLKIAIFSLLYVLLENSFSLLLRIIVVNVLFYNLEDNAFRESDFLQNRSDNIFVLISRMIESVRLYFFKSSAINALSSRF
jgi:hypothetical protein